MQLQIGYNLNTEVDYNIPYLFLVKITIWNIIVWEKTRRLGETYDLPSPSTAVWTSLLRTTADAASSV